ncbi:MAG: hypothetical protein JSS31_11800 [Proteobacteria bacterium]|nr:hypothetical protein [Pseudomonadota bacterium]MBS0494614.1 hypothetical protein [Pseudomonadota bacterium]
MVNFTALFFNDVDCHNVEVIDGHLCIFDSIERERVKYCKFDNVELIEALLVPRNFEPSPKSGQTSENLANTDLAKWAHVKYPNYFIIAFEDCARSDPDYYGPMICDSFELFMEAYRDFWYAVALDDRTPADVEPDEEYLREEHARMAKEFASLYTPDSE